MGKTLKILIIAVGGLIALLIIAVVLVTVFVNPNDYKGTIAQAVEQKTGRKLVFEGNIGLSVFPWVGLELGPLSLSNAKGFKEQPFAKIKGADIRVKIIPLLYRKLEMAKVSLDGLTLNLERHADGKTNWEDLTGPETAKKEEKKAGPEKEEMPLEMFTVGGVEIKNSNVTWDDQKDKVYYAMQNINLNVGSIEPDKPIDFSLGFNMTSKEPAMEVTPHLKGVAKLDLEKKIYEIDGMKLNTTVRGDTIPGKEVKSTLGANIRADLGKQTLDVADLNLDAFGVMAKGGLKADHILDKAAFSGNLTVSPFNPRELFKQLGQEPPATADKKALEKASAAIVFSGTTDSFDLKELTAQLDETNIKGNATVKDLKNPSSTFTFAVDKIDLDRYLPPPSEKKEGEVAKPSGESPAATKPNFEPLRKLRPHN